MKFYPKKYENVFQSKRFEMYRRNLREGKMENCLGYSMDEYENLYRIFFKDFNDFFWRMTVRSIWLNSLVCYTNKNGVVTIKKSFNKPGSGVRSWAAILLGIFSRETIGMPLSIVNSSNLFRMLKKFVHSFYPDIKKINPFIEEVKYPYQYMNVACLFLVSRMEEFREIADYGEEQKMSYIQFLDYVINHVSCVNEDVGREKYIFNFKVSTPPFVSFIPEDSKKNKNFPFFTNEDLKKKEYEIRKRIRSEARKNKRRQPIESTTDNSQ